MSFVLIVKVRDLNNVEHYIGIDGCKSGWIAIHNVNGEYSYQVLKNLKELTYYSALNTRVLIDMPLGLSSQNNKRTIDKTLRKALSQRKSSVFNAPCREALAAKDYANASEISRQIEGKGLSLQSFYLFPKIRELESFYLESKGSNILIYESHPEFCFENLQTAGLKVEHNKKTSEGALQRLALLSHHNGACIPLYNKVVSETKRKDVAKDDIIDALVLCVTNLRSGGQLRFLEDENPKDELGINLQIAY